MRGENRSRARRLHQTSGTSPHAWGKRDARGSDAASARNIPTCVGKTAQLPPVGSGQPEHPHMRGENRPKHTAMQEIAGTSPHAWGKRPKHTAMQEIARNIPTCVGKTQDHARLPRRRPEHPHMRGENHFSGETGKIKYGTSPHAWGKRYVPCMCHDCLRNIPTCVGKTPSPPRRRPTRPRSPTEHPHMRGENAFRARARLSPPGTSPHAWGKRNK